MSPKKNLRSKEHQRKRRKRVLMRLGIGVTVLLAIIGLVAWGSRADAVAISTISVSGNKVVADDEIQAAVNEAMAGAYAWVFPKDSSIFYPKSDIEQTLKNKFTRIATVNLSLQDFSTLQIKTTERAPDGLWCTGEYADRSSPQHSCYFLDDAGFIYAKAPQFSGNVFFRYYGEIGSSTPIGNHYMEESTFVRIRSFAEAVRERLDLNPVGFEKMKESNGRLILDGAADNPDSFSGAILFDYASNLRSTFKDLKTVVEKEVFMEDIKSSDRPLKHIDLRLDDRVYYRFDKKKESEGDTVETPATSSATTTNQQ